MQQSLNHSKQGSSASHGHDHFRISHHRRSRSRRGHLLVIPLGVTVRSVHSVCCKRARSSHSTFSLTHWSHRVTCRNRGTGNGRSTVFACQHQTLQTVGLERSQRHSLRGGLHRTLGGAVGWVSSVLAAPLGATGFHVDGCTLCGPSLLAHNTSDGRCGELKRERGLGWCRGCGAVGRRRGRGGTGAISGGSSAQSSGACRDPQSSPPSKQRLPANLPPHSRTNSGRWSLDATDRCDRTCAFQPLPGLEPPNPFLVSHAVDVVGNRSETSNGTAFDRARDLLGVPNTSHIPIGPPAKARTTQSSSSHEAAPSPHSDLTSSLGRIAAALEKGRGRSSMEAHFGVQGSAAQSEEEYAGMIVDVSGASIKRSGRALLERVRKTRE